MDGLGSLVKQRGNMWWLGSEVKAPRERKSLASEWKEKGSTALLTTEKNKCRYRSAMGEWRPKRVWTPELPPVYGPHSHHQQINRMLMGRRENRAGMTLQYTPKYCQIFHVKESLKNKFTPLGYGGDYQDPEVFLEWSMFPAQVLVGASD